MRKVLVLMVLVGLVMGLNAPVWAADGAKININTATVEELTELKNVGGKTAERIVAYRKANGPFKSPHDLTNVKGIGEKTIEKNKGRISVSN